MWLCSYSFVLVVTAVELIQEHVHSIAFRQRYSNKQSLHSKTLHSNLQQNKELHLGGRMYSTSTEYLLLRNVLVLMFFFYANRVLVEDSWCLERLS